MYGCFKPKKVFNRYIDQEIYVPCGECDFCRNSRSMELQARVEREFLNPQNGTALFVTLTYDNEHLPLYQRSSEKEVIEINEEKYLSYIWRSNRRDLYPSKYKDLTDEDLDGYYMPVNLKLDTLAFAHLCKEDVKEFFTVLRAMFYNDINRNKFTIFKDYEESKFRYFICAEYGSASGRPHYHALLWFSRVFNEAETAYISQVLSKAWKNGIVDCQTVTTAGVSTYVASYVTSASNLPKVLQSKSVRPFCLFSKFPIIGTIPLDGKEIQKMLDTGITKRVKWDDREKSFVDDVFPSSLLRRYFPKCSGYNTKDNYGKLSIYSYVFNYFKDKGVIHDANSVLQIAISDIDWPVRRVMTEDGCLPVAPSRAIEINGHLYETWDYRDKYAAMVCYRYCVTFNYTPEYVLYCIDRIYSRLASDSLGRFYEYQEEKVYHNEYYV